MKAAFVFAAIATAMALCAAAQVGDTPATEPRHCVMSAGEQAVVVAYFNTPTFSKHLLGFPHVATTLADTTQPTATGLDLNFVNLQLSVTGDAIPGDARSDFNRKARESCGVGPLAGLRNVHVVSIPANGSSPVFHRRYGKNGLLVRVSRVGFNRASTIAVMHVSYYAEHSGGGCLYVFERKAGRWVMKTEFRTWTT
ncbi:MAG TPA: hypothetical protein VFQ00_11465 [Terriglobales bacterium]|nr:hypothetical protein [Terriglobales bacterium]